MKVFILGAGMSGLSTAEKLLEMGTKEVLILDKDTTAGGLAKSFEWGGFEHNDLGPHIWHTPNKNLAKEWEERFKELLAPGKFYGKNVIGTTPGKYIDYPLSRETLELFDLETKEKIEFELKQCTKENQIKATSFEEYVTALVGPTLTEMFFKTYPEKLWGVSTSEMTANWAPKRINFTEKTEEFHGNQWSSVGRQGSGAVMNVISQNIHNLGGKFEFDSEITGIIHEDFVITGIVINHSRVIEVKPSDRIVSTIPFNQFAELLGFANKLVYRGALLVYLSIKKPVVIPGNAAFLYFSQKNVPFHRISEQKKFCKEGWPAEKTTLVAEIAFNSNERTNLQINELIEATVNSLIEFELIEREEVLETLAVPLPNVYPLMTNVKEIEFKKIYSSVQDFQQVYFIGTGGEYHYADLQILYSKGKDLGERIIEEHATRHDVFRKGKPTKEVKNFFKESPFIIAEIGLNHGGSVEIAKELMLAAKKSGIEYVKFQAYKSELRISQVYRSNNYFEEVIDTEENLYTMFKKYELSGEDFKDIFTYGKELDLKVFSAVFDAESLELLEELNCPAYKIASMDLNNYPLIEKVARIGKPIILSTGMSSLGEIENAVKVIEKHRPSDLIILHCISSYPANQDSLNLRAMETLKLAFGRRVGFSDHTIGITAPLVAVSLGAACVEKHFTLDHHLEGPDHIFSLNPSEMTNLVSMFEDVPRMLGSSSVISTIQETETSFKFKKSIHAATDIARGKQITEKDLIIKGPYGGIPPEFYNVVIGRIAQEDIKADYPVTWQSV